MSRRKVPPKTKEETPHYGILVGCLELDDTDLHMKTGWLITKEAAVKEFDRQKDVYEHVFLVQAIRRKKN